MFAHLASSLLFFFPTCAMSIADMAAEVVLHKQHASSTGLAEVEQPALEPSSFESPAPPPCPPGAEQLLNDALNTILALTTSTTVTTTTAAPVPCTTHEHQVKESVAKDILQKALTDIAKGSSSSAEKAAKILEEVYSITSTTVTTTVTTTTVTTVTASRLPPCNKPPTLDPTIDVVDALSKLAASLSTTSPPPCKDNSSLGASLSKLQAAVEARKGIHVKTPAALAVDPTATVSAMTDAQAVQGLASVAATQDMKINAISTGPTEALAAELPKSASIRRAQPPSP